MKDDRFPLSDKYYCKKCKMSFVPAYDDGLCTNCGSENVVPINSLGIPDRDWKKDPSYMEYILKNKGKNKTN